MRQSTDNFASVMTGLDKPADTTNRLDQVAEMVSQMEKRLTDKITEANSQLIDKMQRKPDVENNPEMGAAPFDQSKGENEDEDNRCENKQSEEE